MGSRSCAASILTSVISSPVSHVRRLVGTFVMIAQRRAAVTSGVSIRMSPRRASCTVQGWQHHHAQAKGPTTGLETQHGLWFALQTPSWWVAPEACELRELGKDRLQQLRLWGSQCPVWGSLLPVACDHLRLQDPLIASFCRLSAHLECHQHRSSVLALRLH